MRDYYFIWYIVWTTYSGQNQIIAAWKTYAARKWWNRRFKTIKPFGQSKCFSTSVNKARCSEIVSGQLHSQLPGGWGQIYSGDTSARWTVGLMPGLETTEEGKLLRFCDFIRCSNDWNETQISRKPVLAFPNVFTIYIIIKLYSNRRI